MGQMSTGRVTRIRKEHATQNRRFSLLSTRSHRQRIIVHGIDYGQLEGLHFGAGTGRVDGEVNRIDGVAQRRRQYIADDCLQLLLILIHGLDGAHTVHGDAHLYIDIYIVLVLNIYCIISYMYPCTYVRIAIHTHLTLKRIVVDGYGHACTESGHGDLVMRGLHLARLLPKSLHLQHRHRIAVEGDEL